MREYVKYILARLRNTVKSRELIYRWFMTLGGCFAPFRFSGAMLLLRSTLFQVLFYSVTLIEMVIFSPVMLLPR